jgi:hypothetical protein
VLEKSADSAAPAVRWNRESVPHRRAETARDLRLTATFKNAAEGAVERRIRAALAGEAKGLRNAFLRASDARGSTLKHLLRKSRAPAFAVAKLSQNPIVLTVFGFGLEREQNPRIEKNLRKTSNAMEAMESGSIRPRQVRYQAALRPDSVDPSLYRGFLRILWTVVAPPATLPGADVSAA